MKRIIIAALLLVGAGCTSAPTGEPTGRDEPRVVARPAPRLDYASERPGGVDDDPYLRPRDVGGRSVKTARVRAVHAEDAERPGTTGWLLEHDPWLAWQRGRELFWREFSAADGAFGDSGRLGGPTLDDGATPMMTRDHVSSCALCHNVPWRDAGAGITIAKNGGRGRNTPHSFGAGLVEMIGEQTRLRLLALADRDRDGVVTADEASGVRAVLVEGAHTVDFGRFDDADGDGRPDLNAALFVWYLDEDGHRIPWATTLDAAGVRGYTFELQVFGHGQRTRPGTGGLASTLRAVTASAFDMHAGLTACDPTLNEEPAGDGLAQVSLPGAQQFFTGATRDRALVRDRAGRSLDDPDRDGVIEEITAGDLDLIEWYLLNHPRPAERDGPGRAIFAELGCARCHVPDWTIEAARPGVDYTDRRTGDRRHFDLEVGDDAAGELVGRLVEVERGSATVVRGLYSDFLHHDLGPDCHELQFDGSLIRRFRTAPLWGVGSSAPYGHDGASLDLTAIIRRHGGEAAAERDAYLALPMAARRALLDFLRGLVLYGVDEIPCDVDGDGEIAASFVVAGVDTGRERLNPEWLFRTPARIEGWTTNMAGERIHSRAVLNLVDAYGLALPWLMDRDRDGWPDGDLGDGDQSALRRER